MDLSVPNQFLANILHVPDTPLSYDPQLAFPKDQVHRLLAAAPDRDRAQNPPRLRVHDVDDLVTGAEDPAAAAGADTVVNHSIARVSSRRFVSSGSLFTVAFEVAKSNPGGDAKGNYATSTCWI